MAGWYCPYDLFYHHCSETHICNKNDPKLEAARRFLKAKHHKLSLYVENKIVVALWIMLGLGGFLEKDREENTTCQ